MTDIQFLDSILGTPTQPPPSDGSEPDEEEALDAYSQVITRVAETLIPSVANLRVTRRAWRGEPAEGGGSGVVITPDGYILTSAHVLAGTEAGSASFVDGEKAINVGRLQKTLEGDWLMYAFSAQDLSHVVTITVLDRAGGLVLTGTARPYAGP